MHFPGGCPLPANLKALVERLAFPLTGPCSVCEVILSDRTEEYRRVCNHWSGTSELIRILLTPHPYMFFRARLLELTSREFVILVSDLFRQAGGVVEIGPAGANGAIDILCRYADGDIMVQCKKWKAKVGEPTVREVYAAAVKHQVKRAIIVTTSEFTDPAKWFLVDLRPPPVGLIDGKELFDLMNQHMPSVVADIQEGIWKSKPEAQEQNKKERSSRWKS